MSRRQTQRYNKKQLPRVWLMTDPRLGAELLPAVRRLPTGSGVIFRHYDLGNDDRLKLFRKIRRICRQRGHMLLLGGTEQMAQRWHADGIHLRRAKLRSRKMIQSASVHNRRELAEAQHTGADLVFLSPVFATASHPGARFLGRTPFIALARQSRDMAVIALGGITARNAASFDRRHVHGWAGINAFKKPRNQKRILVPT